MKKIFISAVLVFLTTNLFAQNGDIYSMKVIHHDNPDNNYYSVVVTGDFPDDQKFALYINTDDNKSRGYYANVGAEYLITHDKGVRKFKGQDIWDWNWELQYTATTMMAFTNNALYFDLGAWEIPDLKNSSQFYFETLKDDWTWYAGIKAGVSINTGNTENHDDSQYVYQNNEIESFISDDHKNIKIKKNNQYIISTPNGDFFKNKHGNIGAVTYAIEKKVGGFDVVYTIPVNQTIEKNSAFLSLQIPGIIFQSNGTLNILNPKFKHYLETRTLNTEKGYYSGEAYWRKVEHNITADNNDIRHNYNYFPIGHTVRTVEGSTYLLVDEMAYGTQFVYSPTIVATDTASDLTVGTSLNSNFIEHQVGAKMYIDKKDGSWTYRYDLVAFKDLRGGQELKFTIPVRFAKKKNWIFTLYPYKDFFHNTYEKDSDYLERHPKDVNPIQAIVFSYPEFNTSKSRNWAWNLNPINNELNLSNVLNQFGEMLKEKGYQRSMIWNFTGTYSNWNPGENKCFEDHHNGYHGCIQEQLPFQFLGNPYWKNENILQTNFETDMLDIIDHNYEAEENLGLEYFKEYGIGYDWGIAGQVPVKENGSPISKNTFRPHHLATFNYNDESNDKRWYAYEFLEQVSSLNHSFFQPKFLRLDALNRMQNVKHRLTWLNAIKEKLPDTKLAPESSIDYMHAQAGMINQLDTTDSLSTEYCADPQGTIDESTIKQPDFLAMYLNPGMENIVNLDSIFTIRDYNSRDTYVQTLVKFGYTPLVKYYDDTLGNIDTPNINELVDVHGLNNAYIDSCLNNDGVDDWPYHEACREKNFSY